MVVVLWRGCGLRKASKIVFGRLVRTVTSHETGQRELALQSEANVTGSSAEYADEETRPYEQC